MWLYLLGVCAFIVGLIVFVIRMRSEKIIQKALRMLKENKPDKHVWGQTIASLNIIGTDESKKLASQMQGILRERL